MQKSPVSLDTGIKLVRNIGYFNFGQRSLDELPNIIDSRCQLVQRQRHSSQVVFLIDIFFEQQPQILARLPIELTDFAGFVDSANEPTTDAIDELATTLRDKGFNQPVAVVAMGGGATMDTGKAVSNLLTNGGKAADYQGWDLVKVPGIYKIGIPTLSGTGAEATRTCVMTNVATGLKLGMNSDYTVFDQVIMDPALTATVPRNQYFYTGMDAYIHCIEALAGSYRNAIGDAYSRETVSLCRRVFGSDDMMGEQAREDLMVASYLGGCAIATSYVGIVHPFSAGLSVALGVHHCVANCITMRAMEQYYPKEFDEFWSMAAKQNVKIPEGLCRDLSYEQYQALIDATLIHEKPLTNALGVDFRKTLTDEVVVDLFKKM